MVDRTEKHLDELVGCYPGLEVCRADIWMTYERLVLVSFVEKLITIDQSNRNR